jgi:hypothetical protein
LFLKVRSTPKGTHYGSVYLGGLGTPLNKSLVGKSGCGRERATCLWETCGTPQTTPNSYKRWVTTVTTIIYTLMSKREGEEVVTRVKWGRGGGYCSDGRAPATSGPMTLGTANPHAYINCYNLHCSFTLSLVLFLKKNRSKE